MPTCTRHLRKQTQPTLIISTGTANSCTKEFVIFCGTYSISGRGTTILSSWTVNFSSGSFDSVFAVEGKKLARSEILSNQCLELDVRQRKRFCGGAEIWQSDNFRTAQFDVFCNWNAPPSFVAFYDFCLQSLVSSSALYVNSSITLSKCSSSSKWEFCFKSKLSGHLIVSTMFQLTKWSELPFRMITRSWQEAENFSSSSSSPAAALKVTQRRSTSGVW